MSEDIARRVMTPLLLDSRTIRDDAELGERAWEAMRRENVRKRQRALWELEERTRAASSQYYADVVRLEMEPGLGADERMMKGILLAVEEYKIKKAAEQAAYNLEEAGK